MAKNTVYHTLIYLLICTLTSSCSKISTQKNLHSFFGFEYDVDKNTLIVENVSLFGVVELAQSPNERFVLYTAVDKETKKMGAYKLDLLTGYNQKLNDKPAMIFDPSIDNEGNYVYVQSFNKTSRSWRRSEIKSNLTFSSPKLDGFYYQSIITESHIISALNTEQNWSNIILFDRATGSSQVIPTNLHIYRITPKDNIFVVEAFERDGNKVLYSFIPEKKSLHRLKKESNDEHCQFNHLSLFDCANINPSQKIALVLMDYLSTANDPLNSLSLLDNSEGRLSWHVAMKLDALIRHHNFFEQNNYPARHFINLISKNLSAAFHTTAAMSLKEHLIGWPSTRYSIGYEEYSYLVGNAVIMRSLLMAVKANLIEEATLKNKIIENAYQLFDFHEINWDSAGGYYRIPRGAPFRFDGLPAPWNWSSAMGNMLIELFSITGEAKFYQRATDIFTAFSAEWQTYEDDRIVWHYWPKQFFKGWEAASQLSVNSPSRKANPNPRYEDTSHAALNISFTLRYCGLVTMQELCDRAIVVEGLKKTAQNIILENGSYSRFMDGSLKYSGQHFQPIHQEWAELNPKISSKLTFTLVRGAPFFEGDILNIMLSNVERAGLRQEKKPQNAQN
ncbi:MAG: hypothetical protein GJ680_00175 [Alteromonadaceae bacterium]|nr:hypothetical protein [Alteromonadaceae bacterium]